MVGRYAGSFGSSIALHALVVACLAFSTYTPPSRKASRTVQVVVVQPPAEDRLFPGLKPVPAGGADWAPDAATQQGTLATADLARIAQHVRVLFPFVTPGLALDAFFPDASSPVHLVFQNPVASGGAAAPSTSDRRLALTPATARAIVDKAWSRGERWRAFGPIRELVNAYGADDEQLADLVGMYRDRNALQPYADGAVRDLRLWAQLGLAADHVTFIGFIRTFASSHPSTRVATELLFLLDTIAQANEDALAVLVETTQPDDLQWTRQANPRAYLLMRQVEQQYARELMRLGLISRRSIAEYYENVRLQILAGILKTTPNGYRANDARFLIGAIRWRQHRTDDALRAWRALTPPAGDTYADAIARVRLAVRGADPDRRNIEYILANEQGRWLAFSDERLKRFGYRFDTF